MSADQQCQRRRGAKVKSRTDDLPPEELRAAQEHVAKYEDIQAEVESHPPYLEQIEQQGKDRYESVTRAYRFGMYDLGRDLILTGNRLLMDEHVKGIERDRWLKHNRELYLINKKKLELSR